MSNKPTVYIVDDDQAMRESLVAVLHTADLATQPFASAEEFLAHYQPSHPECMVLDLKMEGMSGTELQEHLAARCINVPIIFLSGHGDVATAVHAVKSGAVDFLEKPANPHKLVERVRSALEQDTSQHEQETQLSEFRARFETLSPREREVLELVVEGLTSKEIAAKLCRSEKTIHLHRARTMKKLGANNVADLVRLTTHSRLA